MATLTDMAAFVAVVEQGSFSSAGRELRVSTAVISARVARLERQIGVRLLNRTTRQVVPTEEAKRYYQDCKNILGQVEQAEASLSSRRENPSGSMKITAPIVFGRRYLASLLSEFQLAYTDLQIRLHLADHFVDLVGEGMDMAIRIADPSDSSLVMKKLADSPRVICASPDYLNVNGCPEKPDDLLRHNCLLLRFPGSTQFQWRVQTATGMQTIPVRGQLDSNNGDVLRQWALEGRGLVLKSRWEIEDDLKAGHLIPVLEKYPPSPVSISALYPYGKMTPMKVRLLIDYLAEKVSAGLG
ncbi:LysR substrate-binding domain-containing protein [Sneathiella sp.]|jgi:DNA-binding transcriptional LysR family regulator|uniref:LysR family transcriptional regulator n=1 Tax=Sneathiella sp. TaxID=1964365 RepID=UPI0039E26C5C